MITPLTIDNTPRPIEDGDAGIVLTAAGGFFVFSSGKIDPENMTDLQKQMGKILLAFSTALQIPQVMNLLFQLSNDPNIVTEHVLKIDNKH